MGGRREEEEREGGQLAFEVCNVCNSYVQNQHSFPSSCSVQGFFFAGWSVHILVLSTGHIVEFQIKVSRGVSDEFRFSALHLRMMKVTSDQSSHLPRPRREKPYNGKEI